MLGKHKNRLAKDNLRRGATDEHHDREVELLTAYLPFNSGRSTIETWWPVSRVSGVSDKTLVAARNTKAQNHRAARTPLV
jgi:hypothetical protein